MLREISQAEKDQVPNDFTHMQEKLKEQNSSRIIEPKNGLTVTKGKVTGEDGSEGREKVGKEGRGPYN